MSTDSPPTQSPTPSTPALNLRPSTPPKLDSTPKQPPSTPPPVSETSPTPTKLSLTLPEPLPLPANNVPSAKSPTTTTSPTSTPPPYPPLFQPIHFAPITDNLPLQRFFIATRLRDIFKTSHIHIPLSKSHPLPPPPPDSLLHQEYLRQCDIVLSIDKTFDSPRRYTLHTESQGTLLSLVRGSAGNFWDLTSGALFADVPPETLIARVHAFEAVEQLWALVPVRDIWQNGRRLEMQPGPDIRAAFGGFVLGVGDERKGAAGLVRVERHYLDVELKNCTREQAVLWLALIVAAELEIHTPLVQFVSRT